jgi:O-methyltransferase involved in polyketide biosynthesis
MEARNMKEGQSSRTAEAAAALRANHFQNAKNPVFSDPFAPNHYAF